MQYQASPLALNRELNQEDRTGIEHHCCSVEIGQKIYIILSYYIYTILNYCIIVLIILYHYYFVYFVGYCDKGWGGQERCSVPLFERKSHINLTPINRTGNTLWWYLTKHKRGVPMGKNIKLFNFALKLWCDSVKKRTKTGGQKKMFPTYSNLCIVCHLWA